MPLNMFYVAEVIFVKGIVREVYAYLHTYLLTYLKGAFQVG